MQIKQALAAFVVASVCPTLGGNKSGMGIGASAVGGIEECCDCNIGNIDTTVDLGQAEAIAGFARDLILQEGNTEAARLGVDEVGRVHVGIIYPTEEALWVNTVHAVGYGELNIIVENYYIDTVKTILVHLRCNDVSDGEGPQIDGAAAADAANSGQEFVSSTDELPHFLWVDNKDTPEHFDFVPDALKFRRGSRLSHSDSPSVFSAEDESEKAMQFHFHSMQKEVKSASFPFDEKTTVYPKGNVCFCLKTRAELLPFIMIFTCVVYFSFSGISRSLKRNQNRQRKKHLLSLLRPNFRSVTKILFLGSLSTCGIRADEPFSYHVSPVTKHSNDGIFLDNKYPPSDHDLSTLVPPTRRMKDGIKRLEKLNQGAHLRGGSNDLDTVAVLTEVSNVLDGHISSLLDYQARMDIGDKDTAGNILKAFVEEEDMNRALDSSSPAESSVALTEIPNEQLVDFVPPEFVEKTIEHSKDAMDSIQRLLDVNFKQENMEQGTSSQENAFNFHFNNFGSSNSFSHTGSRQHKWFTSPSEIKKLITRHRSNQMNGFTMPSLSKFTKLHNDGIVMAKHQARLQALGETCSSCDLDDFVCNCKKLFGCVRSMTEYDLAVLVAAGFIDTNAVGGNFGNFTVGVQDLNLYDADEGVKEKLTRLKGIATDQNAADRAKCDEVLSNLFSACNPDDSTCTNPNSQSYSLSTDQVCAAVDTPKKLLFESIGEEFDGFANRFTDAPDEPLSYTACADFALTFDRLYESRATSEFPLSNPMRKTSSVAISSGGLENTFNQVRFPVDYVFPQDESTGIVTREFGSQSDGLGAFYLVNPHTGKVLGVKNNHCHERFIEVQDRKSGSRMQQWLLEDNYLRNQGCSNYEYLTNAEYGCTNGNRLRLNSFEAPDRWTFYTEGRVVNEHCGKWKGDLAISAIEDDSIVKNGKTDDIPFSFVNLESNLALGVNGACIDGVSVNALDRNSVDDKQQFYLKRSSGGANAFEIENVACPGKVLSIPNNGVNADGTAEIIANHANKGEWFKVEKNLFELYFGAIGGHRVEHVKQCRNGQVIRSGTVSIYPPNGDYIVHFGYWLPQQTVSEAAGSWEADDFIVKPTDSCTGTLRLESSKPTYMMDHAVYPNGIRAEGGAVCSDMVTAGCTNGLYFKVDKDEAETHFGISNWGGSGGVEKLGKQCRSGQDIKSGKLWFFPPYGEFKEFFGCWRASPSAGDWKEDDYIVKPDEPCKYYLSNSVWELDSGNVRSASPLVQDMVLQIKSSDSPVGSSIVLAPQNYLGWTQKWTTKSTAAVLLPNNGKPSQEWKAESVVGNYNYGLLPGFPGADLSSRDNEELAKAAMRTCDDSMSLLLGHTMSLGTLKAITDEIQDGGPKHMPGECCLDDATNSEYFGYRYDPTLNNKKMTCQHRGPWHLGLSHEACENAGGNWYRSPCVTLKECINNRPSRFQLDGLDGSCQETSGQLNTAYVYQRLTVESIEEKENLVASDGTANDYFGYSVAVSGSTILVGALNDDDKGNSSGWAYIYEKNGTSGDWEEKQKLVATNRAANNQFGSSVAVSGGTILVGACGDDDKGKGSGSVFIYEKNQTNGHWQEKQKLVASDGAASDQFGSSVAMSGNTILVGASHDDDKGSGSGSVYIYQKNLTSGHWEEKNKLVASDGAAYDQYGSSVAMSGITILVGASYDDDKGSSSGSVYVYEKNPTRGVWEEKQKLVARDGAANDRFGWRVAVSGDVAVVGTQYDDGKKGSAYIYQKNPTSGDWEEKQKLVARDGNAGDLFGRSIAVSGDVIIVGAYGDDNNKGNSSGSAYIYEKNPTSGDWEEKKKLVASDGAAFDRFGSSVAVSGSTVLVGAPFDDDKGTYSGSVYIYETGVTSDSCLKFCKSLPGYSLQSGMELHFSSRKPCSCLYHGTQVPSKDLLPDNAIRSLPKFSLKDPSGRFALGLSSFRSCEETDSIDVQLQSGGVSILQQFRTTSDGQIVSAACPSKVLTAGKDGCSSGSALQVSPLSNGKSAIHQQWHFDNTGRIISPSCPSLNIAGMKDDDSSILSYYFALENPKTHLSIGAEGECVEGMQLKLHKTVYGALNQQFLLQDKKLVSVMCPELSMAYAPSGLQQVAKLVASDGAANDSFGLHVAIFGDVAVVGAHKNNEDKGSTYIYQKNQTSGNWEEKQKLIATDGEANHFGSSVAVSGSTILVGAYRDDDKGKGSGSAYVYQKNPTSGDWEEKQKLVASDGAAWDRFGYSVAVSGSTVLVGAYDDDDKAIGSGSAYVYQKNPISGDWEEKQKLVARDGAAYDYFGSSVAVSGGTILVAAGSGNGSAYVYQKNGTSGKWEEKQKLFASDGAAGDNFGVSVAVSGDVAIIGTKPGDGKKGSAYIYEKNPTSGDWEEKQKLVATDGEANDYFGYSVAVSGNTILVGASLDDDKGKGSGSAYVYRKNPTSGDWEEKQKLVASDGAAWDRFGYSVAVSGSTILVGAYGDDDKGTWGGSAYIYEDFGESFVLSSNGGTWKFDEEQQTIESIEYPGAFISIAAEVPSVARARRQKHYLLSTVPSFEDSEEINAANYATSQLPSAGTGLVLAKAAAVQYQSWRKMNQQLQNIVGPFSFINSAGLALHAGSGEDSKCSIDMSLTLQNDNYSSIGQQFFSGPNGRIISAKCPGLVVSIGDAASCDTVASQSLKLHPHQLETDRGRWSFINGRMESVKCPGLVISAGSSAQSTVVLRNVDLSNQSQVWKRQNLWLAGLPVENSTQAWMQDWFVHFDEPGYEISDLGLFMEGIKGGTSKQCFPQNAGFSKSFDEFALGFVILDASNEDECARAREEMGFDRDHPFDTEICDRFADHMCDQLFTGIDHMADPLPAPPKFEAAEYEEAEYSEVIYEAPSYADDPPLIQAKLETPPGATKVDTKQHKRLVDLDKVLLDLETSIMAFEQLSAFTANYFDVGCDIPPENICTGPVCFYNPGKLICLIARIISLVIEHVVLLALRIAYQVTNREFENGTIDPDVELYAYDYTVAIHTDLNNFVQWNYNSLGKISTALHEQHTSMRQHLQDRHLSMEQNIGEDIFDAQNALGEAIVDAQNANGQAIVDARNANSDQHNRMLGWQHATLCQIYEKQGGSCTNFIGPLQEDQEHIPVELVWPEGQPTVYEQLQQIQSVLSKSNHEGGDHGLISSQRIMAAGSTSEIIEVLKLQTDEMRMKVDDMVGKHEDVAGKVDAVESKVDGVESKVDAVESKVDGVESKVDAVEGKVEDLKDSIKEMKEMMSKLMQMMQ